MQRRGKIIVRVIVDAGGSPREADQVSRPPVIRDAYAERPLLIVADEVDVVLRQSREGQRAADYVLDRRGRIYVAERRHGAEVVERRRQEIERQLKQGLDAIDLGARAIDLAVDQVVDAAVALGVLPLDDEAGDILIEEAHGEEPLLAEIVFGRKVHLRGLERVEAGRAAVAGAERRLHPVDEDRIVEERDAV